MPAPPSRSHSDKSPDKQNALIPLQIALQVKAVTFYVMGADARLEPKAPGNYWTTLDDFPVPDYQSWYLDANGFSLSRAVVNSGTLSTTYVYDPANPVPTIGGNNLFTKCGPLDQTPVEAPVRSDVLSFTSPALSAPLVLTGTHGNIIEIHSPTYIIFSFPYEYCYARPTSSASYNRACGNTSEEKI